MTCERSYLLNPEKPHQAGLTVFQHKEKEGHQESRVKVTCYTLACEKEDEQ